MRDRLETLRSMTPSPTPSTVSERPTATPNQQDVNKDDNDKEKVVVVEEKDQFIEELEQIRNVELKTIEKTIESIDRQHRAVMSAPDAKTSQQAQTLMEKLTADFSSTCNGVRQRLRALSSNMSERLQSPQSDTRIFMIKKHQVLLQNTTKRFLHLVKEFEAQAIRHQKVRQDQMAQRLRMIKPGLNDSQVKQLVQEGVSEDDRLYSPVLSQQLLSPQALEARRREALGERDWMEARRSEMLQLQKVAHEVSQLMLDIQMMVSQQGQVIHSVEETMEETADTNVRSKENVKKSLETAKLSQRRRVWMTVIILSIMAALIIAIIILAALGIRPSDLVKMVSDLVALVYIGGLVIVMLGIYMVYKWLSPSRWLGKTKKSNAGIIDCCV